MKIVREHINEIFTDDSDSDPIQDMGIGNDVVRMKPGDIIEVIKTCTVRFNSSSGKQVFDLIFNSKKGNMQNGYTLNKGSFGVVVNKKMLSGNKIEIESVFWGTNIDYARKFSGDFINIYKYDYDHIYSQKRTSSAKGITSYSKWSKYLKLIESI